MCRRPPEQAQTKPLLSWFLATLALATDAMQRDWMRRKGCVEVLESSLAAPCPLSSPQQAAVRRGLHRLRQGPVEVRACGCALEAGVGDLGRQVPLEGWIRWRHALLPDVFRFVATNEVPAVREGPAPCGTRSTVVLSWTWSKIPCIKETPYPHCKPAHQPRVRACVCLRGLRLWLFSPCVCLTLRYRTISKGLGSSAWVCVSQRSLNVGPRQAIHPKQIRVPSTNCQPALAPTHIRGRVSVTVTQPQVRRCTFHGAQHLFSGPSSGCCCGAKGG